MTSEMHELIERLRGYGRDQFSWRAECERKAADAIQSCEARIATLEGENARLKLDVDAQECLCDSAYKAGLMRGWNLGICEDDASFQREREGTEHLKRLAEIKKARATLSPEREG